MITYVIRQNVVSDDELLIPDENKVFKGNYIAILKYNTYATEWTDKQHIKRFRSYKSLDKYLAKKYTKKELQDLGY